MVQRFLQRPVSFLFEGDSQPQALTEKILWPAAWHNLFGTGLDTAGKIDQIWLNNPFLTPSLRQILHAYTHELALVVSTQPFIQLWGVAYLHQYQTPTQLFIDGWIGGLPATSVEQNLAQKRLQLSLPPSYQTFTQTHNGFTAGGNFGYGFQALQTLELREEGLVFYEDGAGNQQLYRLSEPEGEDFWTYDYDHETHELTQPLLFGSFFEKWLTAVFK